MTNTIFMIFNIVVGLIIWLVLPLLLQGWVKRANVRRAIDMLCKIVGLAIIVMAVWDEVKSLF